VSDFFELFQPGLKHQREQRDLDKILVVEADAGGTGPRPMNLDSGKVVLRVPNRLEPPTPEPDSKDWTWVLQRPCPECGFTAVTVHREDFAALVRQAAAPWPDVLARADASVRPSPQVWSPLEYGCHVRDVLRVFDGRLALLRTQTNPKFDNWDQDAAAIEDRYWDADPAVVAAEILDAAEQHAAAWAKVRPSEWDRPGRRSNGSVFTVESLGRYELHDLVHHLWDVRG
jgi:hypothetical protein